MKPTIKDIQVIEECVCGHVLVDHIQVAIKIKDFSKAGIRKRKDRKTGGKFLVMYRRFDECNCNS